MRINALIGLLVVGGFVSASAAGELRIAKPSAYVISRPAPGIVVAARPAPDQPTISVVTRQQVAPCTPLTFPLPLHFRPVVYSTYSYTGRPVSCGIKVATTPGVARRAMGVRRLEGPPNARQFESKSHRRSWWGKGPDGGRAAHMPRSPRTVRMCCGHAGRTRESKLRCASTR